MGSRRTQLVVIAIGAALLVGCRPAGTDTTAPPVVTEMVTVAPSPTEVASPTPSAEEPLETVTISLFFSNHDLAGDSTDCGLVFSVNREIPAADDLLTPTLNALLAGPTEQEASLGFTSWFSEATASSLISSHVVDSNVYVNLTDFSSIIPGASSSCGSAQLLSSLKYTVLALTGADDVLFAFDGDPRPFWEWLQMSCDTEELEYCDQAPFLHP